MKSHLVFMSTGTDMGGERPPDQRPRMVTETIFQTWDNSDIPEKLGPFAEMVNGWLAACPEQYRDSAEVEFRADSDGYQSGVTVAYMRPETEAESKERLVEMFRQREREQNDARARELSLLAALKLKYEP